MWKLSPENPGKKTQKNALFPFVVVAEMGLQMWVIGKGDERSWIRNSGDISQYGLPLKDFEKGVGNEVLLHNESVGVQVLVLVVPWLVVDGAVLCGKHDAFIWEAWRAHTGDASHPWCTQIGDVSSHLNNTRQCQTHSFRPRRRSDFKYWDLQILTVSPSTLLRDGDSVYSRETLFEILGTPEEMFLICTGNPMKTCWKFWRSWLFPVRSPPSVARRRIVSYEWDTSMHDALI